jgi:hypothetical protein
MDLKKINEERKAKNLKPLTEQQASNVLMQIAQQPRSRALDVEPTSDEEILASVKVD